MSPIIIYKTANELANSYQLTHIKSQLEFTENSFRNRFLIWKKSWQNFLGSFLTQGVVQLIKIKTRHSPFANKLANFHLCYHNTQHYHWHVWSQSPGLFLWWEKKEEIWKFESVRNSKFAGRAWVRERRCSLVGRRRETARALSRHPKQWSPCSWVIGHSM